MHGEGMMMVIQRVGFVSHDMGEVFSDVAKGGAVWGHKRYRKSMDTGPEKLQFLGFT